MPKAAAPSSSPFGPRRMRVRAAGLPAPGLSTLYAVAATVGVLYLTRELLVPLVLASLLAFVLAPVLRLLRRAHIPRVGAVLITVVIGFGAIAAVGGVMGQQLAQLATDLPRYQRTVTEKLGGLTGNGSLLGRASAVLHELGNNLQREERRPEPAARSSQPPPMPVEIHQAEPGTLELIQRVVSPLLGPVATLGIVAVFVIFLLLYREDLRDRLIKLVGSRDLQRTTAALDEAATRLSRYFLAQVIMNACFGVVISLGLWLIGVPNPALWGALAGLMRFVPFVGIIIAVVFPALLAMAVDPGWGTLLWTLALFGVAEPLMAQAVEPLVYGHSTGLTPIAVLVATAFWTWLWGPLGLLMAMPLTVGLVVLGRHVEQLEFLDVLLGDREALAPPEAFYQRLLAGDGDGLAEQAELRLKSAPLCAYYDEVALPGLALAQADAARGSLEEDRLQTLGGRVAGLLSDLEDHEDDPAAEPLLNDGPVTDSMPGSGAAKERPLLNSPAAESPSTDDRSLADRLAQGAARAVGAEGPEAARPGPGARPATPVRRAVPPDWAAPGAVLCIAGRGRFDAQAAIMLGQVLARWGIGTVLRPNEALRELRPGSTDAAEAASPVRAVCLSVLDGGAGVASTRFALRRLRRRFPDALLLLGAWNEGPGGPLSEAMQTEHTDHRVVGSLREAARLCQEAALRDTPAPAPAPGPGRLAAEAAPAG
ncbi:AI-2E family transporter [Roseomonas elaeocarpi]|uniref:AI-2E family transporter n=1 Tax=Roseomonas elaeocarpi TaxID=907779 RepID=A0ABV6JY46_9PROT